MTELRSLGIVPTAEAVGADFSRARWYGDRCRINAPWRPKSDSMALAINRSKNTWYDFVAGRGGRVLSLVETARGCTRAEALNWLESRGYIAPRDPSSPEAIAARRRAAAAEKIMPQLLRWRRERMRELDAEKVQALTELDWEGLERSSSALHVIQNGEAVVIVEAFAEHVRRDPAGVGRLLAAAQDDEQHAQQVVAYVCALLVASVAQGRVAA